MRYAHLWSYLTETPWAILPAKLEAIREALALRVQGVRLSDEEIEARLAAERERYGRQVLSLEAHQEILAHELLVIQDHEPQAAAGDGAGAVNVAILPIYGTISQRAGLFSDASGGTSTEKFAQRFRQAMADPSIGAIVMDVDSPGGSVFGVPELADEIFRSRGRKPIVAVANSMAASAAYWIASAAEQVSVTPSGQVGSIGVFAMHEDLSRMYDQAGVTTTLIAAGRYKVEGNEFEPLSEEARGEMQAKVESYYGDFTAAVARGRGVPVSTVRNGFGEGRMVRAKEAVEQKMADRMETLGQAISRVAGSLRNGRMKPAADLIAEPIIAAAEATDIIGVDEQRDADTRRRRRLLLNA